LDVLGEHSPWRWPRRWGPGLPSTLQLGSIKAHIKPAIGHIQDDLIAILDEGNRATVHRLRGDVTDTEAGCPPGEAAVGDQHDVLAETGALDRGGNGQHLAHPRATFGALI